MLDILVSSKTRLGVDYLLMWQQYRDELTTMGLVFMVSAVGLFFVTSRFLEDASDKSAEVLSPTPSPLPVLGISEVPTAPPSPTVKLGIITPTIKLDEISPSPTPVQVPYGQEGAYAYESYQIEFMNPRLVFGNGANNRRFTVDVVIKNISFAAGLSNALTAEIVKDGNVIVPEAPLSVSESKLILPGQKLSFTARLSLIDGTDVVSLRYSPDQLPETKHELQ